MIELENSGSIENWMHTPNLTPKGHELKKDELYVLGGDVLIQVYHLLMTQRVSSLMVLSKIPPTEAEMYENYLSLSKHINAVMFNVLQSLPLASILQMHEEARLEEKKRSNRQVASGLTLKEILDKYHLSEGGKDELRKKTPPSPETENPIT